MHNYNGTAFQTTSPEEYLERYKLVVNIKHRKDEGHLSFDPGKDVKSVIFSFQEIFVLLYDNSTDEIKIYNAIRKVYDFDGFEVKHSLVLATEGTGYESKSFMYSFYNRYANLTHLCPPNCARFLYPIEI